MSPSVIAPTNYYTREGSASPGALSQEMFPWCRQQMLNGREVVIASLEDLPAEAAVDRESARLSGIKSNLTLPLAVGGEHPVGALAFNALRAERDWPDALVKRVRLVAQVFTNALARRRHELSLQEREEALRQSCAEITLLKDRLRAESDYLKAEIRVIHPHGEIIGQSSVMKQVMHMVEQVAPTGSSVLVCGETGTGKELVAQAIHRLSDRRAT